VADGRQELLVRFRTAQEIIGRHILDEKVTLIPYRAGSRSYTPEEHLEIVSRHILTHLKDLEVTERRVRRRSGGADASRSPVDKRGRD
jgi:hypothetical protein